MLGLDRPSLKIASSAQGVRIYGANLPANAQRARHRSSVAASRVTRVVSSDADARHDDVTSPPTRRPARAILFVAGAVSRPPLAVYESRSTSSRSRRAGTWRASAASTFPKMLAQFEAIGVQQRRPTASPTPRTTSTLGPVDATWTHRGIHGDLRRRRREVRRRDRRPAPARSRRRSTGRTRALGQPQQRRRRLGRGDTRRRRGRREPTPMRARAHLVVTVPLYMRWDFFTMGGTMIALQPGDCHSFEAAGRRFLYLAPSAAVMAHRRRARRRCSTRSPRVRSRATISSTALAGRFAAGDIDDSVAELRACPRARPRRAAPPAPLPKILPLTPVPLQTLVVNVTNQCNLACTYCYEYGEDKIVETENGQQPKFMSEETARESVEFLLRESRLAHAHMTFFGGETLMNFKVLQDDDRATRGSAPPRWARTSTSASRPTRRCSSPSHRVPRRATRRRDDLDRRARRNCRTSSASSTTAPAATTMVAPKIKALLARHRSRPIGARVTLTRETLDVRRIYDHLHERTRLLGSRLRAGDHRARPRLRVRRRRLRTTCSRSSAISRPTTATPRSRIAITGSPTCARRSARFTRARARRVRAARASACSASPPTATSRSAIASPGRTITSWATCTTASIARSSRVPRVASHRQQDRLRRRAGRGRSAPAAAITKPTRATASTERPNLHYCEWIRGWTRHLSQDLRRDRGDAIPASSGSSTEQSDEAPQAS